MEVHQSLQQMITVENVTLIAKIQYISTFEYLRNTNSKIPLTKTTYVATE